MKRTRLQRKRDKDSLKLASKYLILLIALGYVLIRFGLPMLIRMASFISQISSSNKPIELEDTLAPRQPVLQPATEATSSAEIDIAGFSESGVTIKLFLSGINTQETVTNNQGEFLFKQIRLRDGENELYAIAIDDQGNESQESSSIQISLDQTAPILIIDNPSDGDKFFDKDSPMTISGQTDEEAELRINDRFVLVGSEGKFETTWPLSNGDNDIKIVSKDKAGNQTETSLRVHYSE